MERWSREDQRTGKGEVPEIVRWHSRRSQWPPPQRSVAECRYETRVESLSTGLSSHLASVPHAFMSLADRRERPGIAGR